MGALKEVKSNRSGADTYQSLLDAAFAHYTTFGYHKCSLKEIGRSQNISGPAIYYHFKSKDDLLCAAYEDHITWLIETQKKLAGGLAVQEKLWVFAAAHTRIQFFGRDNDECPALYGIHHLIPQVPEPFSSRLKRLARNAYLSLRSIVEQGQSEGVFKVESPRSLTFAIFGITHNAPIWFDLKGDIKLTELMVENADYALRLADTAPLDRKDWLLNNVLDEMATGRRV